MINKERIDEAKRNVKQYIEDGLLKINDNDAEVCQLLHGKRRIFPANSVHSTTNIRRRCTKRSIESWIRFRVLSMGNRHVILRDVLFSDSDSGKARHKNLGPNSAQVTADALIHFFGSNEKLAKLLEQYEEAQTFGLELVGREELMKKMQKKAD